MLCDVAVLFISVLGTLANKCYCSLSSSSVFVNCSRRSRMDGRTDRL